MPTGAEQKSKTQQIPERIHCRVVCLFSSSNLRFNDPNKRAIMNRIVISPMTAMIVLIFFKVDSYLGLPTRCRYIPRQSGVFVVECVKDGGLAARIQAAELADQLQLYGRQLKIFGSTLAGDGGRAFSV